MTDLKTFLEQLDRLDPVDQAERIANAMIERGAMRGGEVRLLGVFAVGETLEEICHNWRIAARRVARAEIEDDGFMTVHPQMEAAG